MSLTSLSHFLAIFLLSRAGLLRAQNGPTGWTASPFSPPALPLAVSSPYLNTWLPQGNNPPALNEAWPNIGAFDGATGWYSSVVVDGTAYRIMGDATIANVSNAKQTGIEFTATRTSFIFEAGPMQINTSFISPIEPKDLVRQSLPFSYYTMSASSLDGNPHQLRIYSDITGGFVTGGAPMMLVWNALDEGQHIVLSMQQQIPQKYTETNGRSGDAVEFYACKKISDATISWAITDDVSNRNRAANLTSLGNQQDTPPRFESDHWPTLGIAFDWQSTSATSEPAVWAIGVVRSPAIQYHTPNGKTLEYFPYFLTQWSDGITATKAFLDNFQQATAASSAFDAELSVAGNTVSSEYADLLALSARQVMGTLDITLSKTGGGEWNFSDTKVFMKNMGSAGSDADTTGTTIASVNTVDTLYAALPAFLYLNPEIAGYLLSPLLEYQDFSAHTLSYAARNIGSFYPNATAEGTAVAHDYRIEETANMLIMTLAYSQRSGNGTFLSKHYTLLRGWAEYLENNTMSTLNDKSADSPATLEVSNNNQTNLMLKGIIGIACMSEIAELAKVTEDQQRFNSTATSFISQWQTTALSADDSHINLIAGDTDTNGLIYNLFADRLLQLNVVPDKVYQVATTFYNNIAGQARYGIPLDNEDSGRTGAHWMMLSASTVQDSGTRDLMINQVHEYATSNRNSTPFSLYYSPSDGVADSGSNAGSGSPAIGGVFAVLALNTALHSGISLPQEGSTIPESSPLASRSKSNAGAIAGGVVGGLATVILCAGILFYLRRRWQLRKREKHETRVDPMIMAEGVLSAPGPNDSQPELPSLRGDPRRASQQILITKQTLANEELRSEVNNLRRDIDRIREERRLSAPRSEAPPEYDGPS